MSKEMALLLRYQNSTDFQFFFVEFLVLNYDVTMKHLVKNL